MKIKELDNLLKDKKSLGVTLLLSLLYIVPLLLSNYEYLDDYGRNLFGYGWQHDGRFAATLMGKMWSLNGAVFSIYPYSLLLSAVILGFTGYLLVSMLGIENGRLVKWSSLLVVTAPYYLGNLVFKFDCLPMAMSLFTVVFPFVFYHDKKKFFIFSVLGVFLSLALYQSGATVLFIAGSAFLIREVLQRDWKTFCYVFAILLLSFLLGYVCYTIVLKVWNLELAGRASLIFSKEDPLEILYQNNELFFKRISLLLRSGSYKYIIAVFLGLTFLAIGFSIRAIQGSALNRLLSLLVVAIMIVVNFWLISGVNILLADSYWDLRTFCGLGFVLILLAGFHRNMGERFQMGSRVSTALLVFFSFTLIAQFGKTLTNQTEFQKDFMTEIKPFLSKQPVRNIGIIGTLTIAPKNYFAYSNFPVFENFLNDPIGQFSSWNKEVLNVNGSLDDVNILTSNELICKGDIVQRAKFYTIRTASDTLIIDFNRNNCDSGSVKP